MNEIEIKRLELHRAIDLFGIGSKEVLEISKEMDVLIVKNNKYSFKEKCQL